MIHDDIDMRFVGTAGMGSHAEMWHGQKRACMSLHLTSLSLHEMFGWAGRKSQPHGWLATRCTPGVTSKGFHLFVREVSCLAASHAQASPWSKVRTTASSGCVKCSVALCYQHVGAKSQCTETSKAREDL